MELCLFQGTFNPIHNAHIRVAEYVINNGEAKKVIFIPAFNPPHKNTDIAESTHRYNMVKLATEDYECFEVSDIEYKRAGISYTYLTISELTAKYKPENRIKFIIGTDAFINIETWYETEKLKDLVEFLVFKRDRNPENKNLEYLRNKGYRFKILPLPFEDISATELRNKIALNEPINEFVPKKVEEYIRKNELYKIK